MKIVAARHRFLRGRPIREVRLGLTHDPLRRNIQQEWLKERLSGAGRIICWEGSTRSERIAIALGAGEIYGIDT